MAENTPTPTPAPDPNAEPGWAKQLRTSMEQAAGGITKLVGLAEHSARNAAAAVPPPDDDSDAEEGLDILSDNSLEVLPRKAFAARILEAMSGRLESTLQKALKPLEQGIVAAQQGTLANRYEADARAFAEKTPDFAEWAEEMTKIVTDNPNLPIRRAYALARAENPTKAAEMTTKYAPPAPPPTKGGKAPLSLSPDSNSSETARNQRQGPEEAAKNAFEETVAKLGYNPFT